jgi:hypothetical protein
LRQKQPKGEQHSTSKNQGNCKFVRRPIRRTNAFHELFYWRFDSALVSEISPPPTTKRPAATPRITMILKWFLEHFGHFFTGSKTVLFPPVFTFFRSRSTGYAPSKTQKPAKKACIFASGKKSPTCSY